MEIKSVPSEQNVEIQLPNGKRKIVNNNNIKLKEQKRTFADVVRTEPTMTRYGRVSHPRFMRN